MRFVLTAMAIAFSVTNPVAAQSSSQEATAPGVVSMPAPQTSRATRVLPAGTIVTLTPLQEITSKRVEEGDQFQFQVINDVIENGEVVITRGSVAIGIIAWKTGRAIGGKSGKFEVTFDHVKVGGRNIPLMGQHRQEGRGNSVGALLGSMLISGRSAVMLPGQVVNALTKEPVTY
jgi:hypothetical protein